MASEGADRAHLALVQPVKLRLERPLEGPYTRVLRRPAPEVEALGQGQTIAILRAGRIKQAQPVFPGVAACYYSPRGSGLKAQDFARPDWAEAILRQRRREAAVHVQYLAVPTGHIKLPNVAWVSAVVAALTPWTEATVEQWRQQVVKSLWLTVLRIYRFEAVPVALLKGGIGESRTAPFRLKELEAVLVEEQFKARQDQLIGVISRAAEGAWPAPPAVSEPASPGYPPQRLPQALTLEQFSAQSGFAQDQITAWEEQLKRKKQLVFYGPPGTGKTYVAERLAQLLAGNNGGFWQIIQFHPAYAYEDFIQGIRPQVRGGVMTYELMPGHFLNFCRRASQLPSGAPCVLLIDELNRAHIAQVFGELMYLLENRGQSIGLAAGGESFAIPENVHIIGTMNTADRSIALVDQALRRRFAFVRLQPNMDVLGQHLRRWGLPATGLIELLEGINRAIGDPNFALGISFFLSAENKLPDQLKSIWQGEIEPYLEEIFYDQPERLPGWRWQAVIQNELKAWA